MNRLIAKINSCEEFEHDNGFEIANAYQNLCFALMGKTPLKPSSDGDDMVATAFCNTVNGFNALRKLNEEFKKYTNHVGWRYAVSEFHGPNGSSTLLFERFEDMVDYLNDECFTSDENFGQYACYDLIKRKHISEKVFAYLTTNRDRYAVVNYKADGTETYDEAATLEKAIQMGREMRYAQEEEVQIYDRESGDMVWEIYEEYDGEVQENK